MLITCKKMHDEIIKMLKPGVKYWDLQDKANSICKEEYGDLLHMVGHSLGIEVHDPVSDVKGYKGLVLQEGMVLTVEPALYVKGLGGVRIEDDLLITKTGCKKLTV
jgi:Xaa-Pro dipeptidase